MVIYSARRLGSSLYGTALDQFPHWTVCFGDLSPKQTKQTKQSIEIPERIEYKIALLAYKVMNGMAPRYLGPFVRVADLPGRRALRSAVSNRLTVPAVKLYTIGSRAFSVSGPQTWNQLPEEITSATSLSTRSIDNSFRYYLYYDLPSNVTSRHSYLGNHFGHYC